MMPRNDLESKLIQIMYAPGVVGIFKDNEGKEFKPPGFYFLALDDEGEITCMEMDSMGWFEKVTGAKNFVRFEFK